MLRGPRGRRESDTPERPNHKAHLRESREREPRRRAVVLGSLTPVFPARGSAPWTSETSCFLSTCVSSDGSFLSVGGSGRTRRSPPPPTCFLDRGCSALLAAPSEAGGEGEAGAQLPSAGA